MTYSELQAWRKENGLKSRWYLSVDGVVKPDPVTLGEARDLREEFRSLPMYVMHVIHAPDGEWIPLDHDEDSSFSFYAAWRKEPASAAQLDVLRFFGKRGPRNLTKGMASEMIDRIYYYDPEARERWEEEKDRQEDEEWAAAFAEDEEDEEDEARPPSIPRKKGKTKKKESSGCGCLLFILLIIIGTIAVVNEFTTP